MDRFDRVVVGFFRRIEAPWAFALVVMCTVVATAIAAANFGIPKAAFQFSAVLIGGYVSIGLLALAIGAVRTMFLMVFSALLLVIVILTFDPGGRLQRRGH